MIGTTNTTNLTCDIRHTRLNADDESKWDLRSDLVKASHQNSLTRQNIQNEYGQIEKTDILKTPTNEPKNTPPKNERNSQENTSVDSRGSKGKNQVSGFNKKIKKVKNHFSNIKNSVSRKKSSDKLLKDENSVESPKVGKKL